VLRYLNSTVSQFLLFSLFFLNFSLHFIKTSQPSSPTVFNFPSNHNQPYFNMSAAATTNKQCCGRAGADCTCAAEATCKYSLCLKILRLKYLILGSCGKKAAGACDCDKAVAENTFSGATCTCGTLLQFNAL
jgi:hypothetical protein